MFYTLLLHGALKADVAAKPIYPDPSDQLDDARSINWLGTYRWFD